MSSEHANLVPLKKILVATDGSKNAERALEAAGRLAKQFGSELIVLSVVMEVIPPVYSPIGVDVPAVDYSAYIARAEADSKKIADDAAAKLKEEAINTRVVILRSITSVAEAILEEATKDNVNLIVVGTRGLGGFKKLLLGSVSSAVVEHSHCSVLIIR